MYTLGQRFKWAFYRIFYYICLAITALTGGLFIYIMAPYSSYIFFNDCAFWKYHKYFPKIIIQLYRIIFLWAFDDNYRGMYAQPLNAPPFAGPDRTRVRLSAEWQHEENDCAKCVNCCVKIKCPLLDYENKKCICYNTFYWRYFSCGRFPVSQRQIGYYECPKWEMTENYTQKCLPGKKKAVINS